MSLRTLVRHSSHYVSGQVCLMALGLVSFPIFTRVLSVADYGVMEMIQRMALLGTAAGKLGVQHAIFRFYDSKEFSDNPEAARRFYSTGILGPAFTSLIAAVVTGAAFQLSTPGSNSWRMALIASALAIVRVIYSVFNNFFRAEERAAFSNWTGVAQRFITVAAILALFAVWGPGLRLYFGATVTAELLFVLFFGYLVVRRGLFSFSAFDKPLFLNMVAFGLPMVLFETVTVALDSSDRLLIRRLAGEEALGYFAAAYTLCIYIQDLIMAPINMAMMPIYTRLWNTEGREQTSQFLSDSFRLYVMATTCLVAGVAACAGPAVRLLASDKYATSATLMPWVVAGLVLYAANAFFNAPLFLEKRTIVMAGLIGVALVCKTLLNIALLPIFGLMGAVASTILGYAILLGITGYYSNKIIRFRLDYGSTVKAIACATIAGWVGLQIELPWNVANLLVRGISVLGVYLLLLIASDRTARGMAQRALGIVSERWQALTGGTSAAVQPQRGGR